VDSVYRLGLFKPLRRELGLLRVAGELRGGRLLPAESDGRLHRAGVRRESGQRHVAAGAALAGVTASVNVNALSVGWTIAMSCAAARNCAAVGYLPDGFSGGPWAVVATEGQ
jgi:hypothetical protein